MRKKSIQRLFIQQQYFLAYFTYGVVSVVSTAEIRYMRGRGGETFASKVNKNDMCERWYRIPGTGAGEDGQLEAQRLEGEPQGEAGEQLNSTSQLGSCSPSLFLKAVEQL